MLHKLIHRSSIKVTLIIILFLNLFAAYNLRAQQIDILLKGGHVIDPKNNIDGQMDVAITNGKISNRCKRYFYTGC